MLTHVQLDTIVCLAEAENHTVLHLNGYQIALTATIGRDRHVLR